MCLTQFGQKVDWVSFGKYNVIYILKNKTKQKTNKQTNKNKTKNKQTKKQNKTKQNKKKWSVPKVYQKYTNFAEIQIAQV